MHLCLSVVFTPFLLIYVIINIVNLALSFCFLFVPSVFIGFCFPALFLGYFEHFSVLVSNLLSFLVFFCMLGFTGHSGDYNRHTFTGAKGQCLPLMEFRHYIGPFNLSLLSHHVVVILYIDIYIHCKLHQMLFILLLIVKYILIGLREDHVLCIPRYLPFL